MPPPSPGKFKGPVVRQLSLQNSSSVQTPSSRGLKKQLSVDDSKVYETVEVTGQRWTIGIAPRELRASSDNGKICQTKILGTRPKPVKVAWADRKLENPEGVEIIATKCQGQPRPLSLKNHRLQSPLLGNKDTLVYTRLQLAERLRNAWSEREKIKPNVNIFLARAPDTTRSENESATDRPTSSAAFQDTASALSDPSAPLDKKRKSMRIRAFSQELPHSSLYDSKHPENHDMPEPALPPSGSGEDSKKINEGSPRKEEKELSDRHLQELNKIEIRMTKIETGAENRESKLPETYSEEPSNDLRQSKNKTLESSLVGKSDLENKDVVESSSPMTAQDRRSNFRRSSILHKTITESFSSGFEESENKIVTKPHQKKPPLVRAFSAPSQNDQQSEAHKAANLQKKVRIISQRRLQPSVSFDIPSTNTEDVAALKERIKSAPVRRRLKSAAARRKNKDKDSSDEEKETKDTASSAKKTSRRIQLKKGSEIVTMVSLVSPAASDTEDSVINLPMESWRGEEKEEPSQSIKPSAGNVEGSKESSFSVQKFVSLRKATKSVTFHPNPVLNRSYSASFPSRRAPAGTPIIVPTPVISNPALTPAQLLERDKRTSFFSSISSGLDGRGIKRKLLRSSNESTKDNDTLDADEKDSKNADGVSENIEKSSEPTADEEEEKGNCEPDFKCPKERECWNLYQKMIEKGVSVSFDTVLRGMLTPTEYRLRKNHLLSNC